MNFDDLIKNLENKRILILKEDLLQEILKLKNLKIVREEETHISGKIRIIEINKIFIIQEITLNHELCLRIMKSLNKAINFIDERLSTYEKMWDGCGCKVDYYH